MSKETKLEAINLVLFNLTMLSIMSKGRLSKLITKIMRTIEVSEETFAKIKDQLSDTEQIDVSQLEDLVGQKLFIRTVTYHLVGKVERIAGHFFVLKDASWIADSGRFMNAIKEGTLDEVEPVGQAFVNINSITDMFPWKHILPTDQK